MISSEMEARLVAMEKLTKQNKNATYALGTCVVALGLSLTLLSRRVSKLQRPIVALVQQPHQ